MQKLSRQQRFQIHYKQQYRMIIGEVGIVNSKGTDVPTIAYKGNTTGDRSRKLMRKYAREAARQAMRAENLQ